MNHKANAFSPLSASLTYALIAALWILSSGWVLQQLVESPEMILRIERYKGLAFVFFTALVMYLILRDWHQHTLAFKPKSTHRSGLYVALFGLVLLVPILAVLVIGIQKPNLEHKIQSQMQAMVDLKDKQIENWLQERSGDAQTLFQDQHFKQAIEQLLTEPHTTNSSSEQRHIVEKRLANLIRFYDYQSVTLLDQNHQPTITLGTRHTPTDSLLNQIKQAHDSAQVTFAADHQQSESGAALRLHWVIPYQLNRSGPPQRATLILHSDRTPSLSAILSDRPVYNLESDAFLLIKRSGSLTPLQERSNTGTQSITQCLTDPLLSKIFTQKQYFGLVEDCDNTHYYLASRSIENTNWLLIKQVRQDLALDEIYTLSGWIAVITFFAVISLSIVIWLMWRQQQKLYSLEVQTTENRLHHFINASPSILYVLKYQAGTFVTEYVSSNIERLLGYPISSALTLNWWQKHLHPDDKTQALQAFSDLLDKNQLSHEYRFFDAKGRVRLIRDEMRLIRDDEGDILEIIGIWNDVTQEKAQKELLTQAKVVFDATQEGIMVTDEHCRILNVNTAFTRVTGYSADQVIGQTPSFLQSGNHSDAFYREMWDALQRDHFWQGEIWNRRKNGDIFPQLLSINEVLDPTGQTTHYVAVFTDITQLKESQEKLDFLSYHDPLTHLPNRALLMSRIEHQIKSSTEEHTPFALLLLDLDYFKDINDSYGHHTGDKVLQLIAHRLKNLLSESDTLARLGGDEFAILLQSQQDPARLAKAMAETLKSPFQTHKTQIRLSGSTGISLYPEHGASAEKLLQNADAALYRAKAQGRNSFAYYTQELTEQARQRIELEAELKQAITRQELKAFYQPQIDLKTGKVIGAEALIRWHSSKRGLVPPNEFIPFAEQTGLINEIGAWMLKEVCRQGSEWLDRGFPPIRLAVNVSAHQFLQGDIESQLNKTLKQTGFPARQLELELTESALINLDKAVEPLLQRLHALGVSLAIDDFGTGYSSLAYLKRFSVDILKIDKSFVDDIESDLDDREIIRAVVSMAHSLGLKTLAEGVESEQQKNYLAEQGCDFYQGYLCSKPLSADNFIDWLRSENE